MHTNKIHKEFSICDVTYTNLINKGLSITDVVRKIPETSRYISRLMYLGKMSTPAKIQTMRGVVFTLGYYARSAKDLERLNDAEKIKEYEHIWQHNLEEEVLKYNREQILSKK